MDNAHYVHQILLHLLKEDLRNNLSLALEVLLRVFLVSIQLIKDVHQGHDHNALITFKLIKFKLGCQNVNQIYSKLILWVLQYSNKYLKLKIKFLQYIQYRS